MSRKLKFIVPALALMWLGGKIIQISTTSAKAEPTLSFEVDEDADSAKLRPLVAEMRDLNTDDPAFLTRFNVTIRSRFRVRQFAVLDTSPADHRRQKV